MPEPKGYLTGRIVILKKNEEKRLRSGHLWVFSNEIDVIKGEPGAGETVEVYTSSGRFVGRGHYNPNSLIAARVFTDDPKTDVDLDLLRERLKACADLRERLFKGQTTYRLCHAEGDFLPGLIVDRYNDHYAVQTYSVGMEGMLEGITAILVEDFDAASVVERNSHRMRALENLEERDGMLAGDEPGEVVCELEGVKFSADPLGGQKTGLYLDQRVNRPHAAALVKKGDEVLDCYCNTGGFGLHALKAGAAKVTFCDSSTDVLSGLERNLELNLFEGEPELVEGNVFELLREAIRIKREWDVVILDPPSFTKTRKAVANAKQGYQKVNSLGMSVCRKGGFFITSSCSHHVREDVWFDQLRQAAIKSGKRLKLLHKGGQSPDHPVLPGMPETAYLKFAMFQVS